MTGTDATAIARVAAHFRWQATACRALGSDMYGCLLDHCATDLESSRPVATLLADHLDQPRRNAVPLRLLAGVHAAVLRGDAPALARLYPSTGGRWDGSDEPLWTLFRDVLDEQADAVRTWLDHPPQTNEVGRGAVLAGALYHVAAEHPLPIRLMEVGASAGLNLRADQVRFDGVVARRGPASSPLVMRDAWLGVAPPEADVQVVERIGVDLAPIDPTTDEGRLRLSAFVWADQVERFGRLRDALELARAVPAELRSGDAVEATRRIELADGAWTVLWHSVFRQYLTDDGYAEFVDAIAALAAAATPAAPFAHLMLEPEPISDPDSFPAVLTTWPGGRRRVLASAPAHGVPVTWTA